MKRENTEFKPDRPEPIYVKHQSRSVQKKSDMDQVVEWLIEGKNVFVTDQFSTGLAILSALKQRLKEKGKKENFDRYREKRAQYYQTSNQVLVPIKDGKIALDKSPEIGWLKNLYPDHEQFYLSFPQVQGLNSSWQWYLKGIKYPTLKHKIHPWYGTYFPTRFDHLLLLEQWLRQFEGAKSTALDIGTGCGVLAFQMLNSGVERVIASDINPNSILTVKENLTRMEMDQSQIEVRLSDLFESLDVKADLILFNPPWLPVQKSGSGLDIAIYYEDDLFQRFFEQAYNHLNEDGRLVVLFSNVAIVEGIESEHPVISELALHNRFKKVKLMKRKAAKKSKRTKRRDHRKREYVELWELISRE